MSDELRAAAERLLDPDDGIGEGTLTDYVVGGYGADDAILLARAYLAEHPADDGEKIDGAFLESLGAIKEDHPDKWTFLRDDAADLGIWRIEIGWKAVLLSGTYASSNLVRPIRCRGEVRRLLAALGLPLVEATR